MLLRFNLKKIYIYMLMLWKKCLMMFVKIKIIVGFLFMLKDVFIFFGGSNLNVIVFF